VGFFDKSRSFRKVTELQIIVLAGSKHFCFDVFRTVKLVRENLKIAQTKSCVSELKSKKLKLIEEKEKLLAKLKETEAKICSVQAEFRQFTPEVLASERNISDLKNRLGSLAYQNRLLAAYDTKVTLFCKILSNYSARLKQVFQQRENRKMNGEDIVALFLSLLSSKMDNNNKFQYSSEFEPIHVRLVRELCTTIQTLLDINRPATAKEMAERNEQIEDNDTAVSRLNKSLEILFRFPSLLFDALRDIVQQQIQFVRDEGKENPIVRPSNERDGRQEPKEMSSASVCQLLREQQEEHSRRALSIHTQKLQIKEIYTELQNKIKTTPNNTEIVIDSQSLSVAKQRLLRELREIGMRLAAESSALTVCEDTERKLQHQKRILTAESEHLSSMLSQITQMESKLKERLEKIAKLLKRHRGILKSFEVTKNDLKRFIVDKIQPQKERLFSYVRPVTDFVSMQVTNFQTALRELKMRQMSVEGQTHSLAVPQYPRTVLLPLLRELGLVGFESPEFILTHITNLNSQVQRIEAEVSQMADFFHFVQDESAKISGKVEAIEERLHQMATVHKDEWQPLLTRTQNEMQAAFKTCDRLKEMLDEWWTQPAQKLASWVTVDGLTLSQWQEKWREMSNKLTVT